MSADKLKIAIIVHGRFHAFDLARELLKLGHDVRLYTNYPKFVAARFGIPRKWVTSFLLHGVLDRLLRAINTWCGLGYPERWMHEIFGGWAAKKVEKENWDVLHAWSGVCEEPFQMFKSKPPRLICERGSSHIAFQKKILEEESLRVARKLEIPSAWIIDREMKEYQLADRVHVPSTFAKETFKDQNFPETKLTMIPLGVNTKIFKIAPEDLKRRLERILSGQSLRVLNVGTFCFRKGAWDTALIVDRLAGKGFEFRFVGPVSREARSVSNRLKSQAKFISKIEQNDLVKQYAWADLFILPTIEDGFPMVLAQAHAAGLPILTTPNGVGHDLVDDGKTGWVLPIRNPEAFIEKLQWCDSHRKELAEMVRNIYETSPSRDWKQVSDELITCFKNDISSALK